MTTYVVRAEDTLTSIAEPYSTTVQALAGKEV
jgi:LysM repeat protein